mgnify:CR=1 FL=1
MAGQCKARQEKRQIQQQVRKWPRQGEKEQERAQRNGGRVERNRAGGEPLSLIGCVYLVCGVEAVGGTVIRYLCDSRG